MKSSFALAVAATAALAIEARGQGAYKRELPDSLVKQAKVPEAAAAITARKRVPKGVIESVELEREHGTLVYSYDLRTVGKSGIDEVQVDAITGKIVSVAHETPAQEAREAAEAARAKRAAPTKRP